MMKKGLTQFKMWAECDRTMNTPSLHPRCGGLTPVVVLQRRVNTPILTSAV